MFNLKGAPKNFREITNLYNKNRDNLTEAIPLWVLTDPSDVGKALLLTSQSDEQHFARGIVTYEGAMGLDDVDVIQLMEDYGKMDGISPDSVSLLLTQ